jgi:hypothetical protein
VNWAHYGSIAAFAALGLLAVIIAVRTAGRARMGKFSREQRARFVMFLGIAILAITIIFAEPLTDALGYNDRWIMRDGILPALGAILLLVGAWKWMDAERGL